MSASVNWDVPQVLDRLTEMLSLDLILTHDAMDMVYARYFDPMYWTSTGEAFQEHEDVAPANSIVVTFCNTRPSNLNEALARVRLKYGIPLIIKQCRMILQRNGGTHCITERSALLVTLNADKELRDAFAKHGIYNAIVRKAWVLMRRTSSIDPAMDAVHLIAK